MTRPRRMAALGVLAAVCAITGVWFDAPRRAVAAAAQGAATRKSEKPVERKGRDYVGRADQSRDQRKLYSFDSAAYKITTDVDKDLANDIAAHMDAVFKEYAERFGRAGFKPNPLAAVKPGERMPLYVLRREKDYVDFLSGFGVNAKNTGGVFFRKDKESGLATWVEGQGRLQMFYTLQHEGFHQFADARIALGLPPWVNEGLADYFGEGVVVDGKLRLGMLDRERLERVRRAVKAGETIPFRELMTMTNDAWLARVAAGNKAAGLMYDQAWSVCYYLIHGGNGGKPLQTKVRGAMVGALDAYLLILNDEFVKAPNRDAKPAAFKEVFSDNLKNFRKAWEDGLNDLKPDPWLSSLRHLQILASAFKTLHEKGVKIDGLKQVEDRLRKDLFHDFPDPAESELVAGEDPKLPPGVLVSGAGKDMPNIRLSWSAGAKGEVRDDISFEHTKRKKAGAPAVAAHRAAGKPPEPLERK